MTRSFMYSISVVRRELALKMWCWGCELSYFVLAFVPLCFGLCQAFRRMGAAPSHKLQLAEHRGRKDEAALESFIYLGASGVILQSSRSVAQEIFSC